MLKLHLDTDLGGDIDDLCALAMVLNWPDVELLAVTTVADDRGRRAGYARYVLDLAGRADVPVAAGADISLDCYRSRPGFPDEGTYWPEPVAPAPGPHEIALSLLERSVEQEASIAAIGAFTNLALLERRSPGILRRAKLVLMGGYLFPPRDGFPHWGREMDYNIQVDVLSAECVLQRTSPTLVPLTVTLETSLRRAYLETLGQSGPLARLIVRQAEAFAREGDYETKLGRTCQGLPFDVINFLHDPLACAVALGWKESVEVRELPLRSVIQDGWMRQWVDSAGKPMRVVTGVEGNKFSEFWLDIVRGARPAALSD